MSSTDGTDSGRRGPDPNAGGGANQNSAGAGSNGSGARKQRNNANKPAGSPKNGFEGRCAELKNHYFDSASEARSDAFSRSLHELADYVGRTFKYGGPVRQAVESLVDATFPLPDDPPDGATLGEMRLWEKAVDEVAKTRNLYMQNKMTLYALAWGQCTNAMRTKLRSLETFQDVSDRQDGIELLRLIRSIAFNYESNKFVAQSVFENVRKLTTCIQNAEESNYDYLERFTNCVAVVEQCGGLVGHSTTIREFIVTERQLDANELNGAQRAEIAVTAREIYLATNFFMNADRRRYKELQTVVQNDFARGQNTFPRTVVEAYELLNNYISVHRSTGQPRTNDGVSFNTVGTSGSGGGGNEATGAAHVNSSAQSSGKSRKTKSSGRDDSQASGASDDAPSTNESKDQSSSSSGSKEGKGPKGVSLTIWHRGYNFISGFPMPKTWVLLDNQSTLDVFSNPELLSNIRQGDDSITVYCNAGCTTINTVGDLPGYGTVWYNESGIANILSLSRVVDRGYQVAYDSDVRNEFLMRKPNGGTVEFKQSEQGLFYVDVATVGSVFINTVVDNQSRYTKRQITRADTARRLQQTLGWPSTRELINIVNKNLIPNCPITEADILAAEDIYGPDLGSLKGKTVRNSVPHVEARTVGIPGSILSQHQHVTLCADVMTVNGVIFLVTISRDIKFRTAEMLASKSAAVVFKALEQVRQVYAKRGFIIDTLLMDGEFDCLRTKLAHQRITLNTTSREEHVPEIERHIRTIKERVRSIWNTLPFERLPIRLIVELVYSATFWLNCFPPSDGVSDTLSPRAIIHGTGIDFNRHCTLQFGEYVQTHEPHDNTMVPRTVGAIALRPSGNDQGGWYFFNLSTGKRISRSHWTRLPMPTEVIQHVHRLARRNKMQKGLVFDDLDDFDIVSEPPIDNSTDDFSLSDPDPTGVRPIRLDDDDTNELNESDDGSHETDSDDESYVPDDDSDEPSDDEMYDSDDSSTSSNGSDNDQAGQNPGVSIGDVEQPGVNQGVQQGANQGVSETDEFNHFSDNENDVPEEQEGRDLGAQMDEAYGQRTSSYSMRERKPRDYSHLYPDSIFSQYSMKAGIKLFGKRGTDAVLKELKQLHDRKVMVPKLASSLTRDERYGALSYLMFLKEKRDGVIKGRGCADGRKQRAYIPKEEATSPTVSTEALFLTAVIDTREGRDVATVDVPGAFMQADMDDTVYMRLEGIMVDLLIELDEAYKDFVAHEKGKRVIYVQLVKALYGTLKAAKLFWEKLTGILKSWGFSINRYDACVANKEINGAQCTIAWHVDDLKISHKDASVVTDVIKQLEGEFAREAPLTINRGKVHDYLGMRLDFSTRGKLRVTMLDYIKNMLAELREDMGGISPNGAASHLFDVNENAEKLDSETAEYFHHHVAKLLFLCKRARPDIQTPVSFLCTRVKAPDVDDYKKLARVMRYLRGTRCLPLTLEGDGMNVVKWWADAAFAVHPDMKSHTGGAMTMGKGVIYGTSTRQKINTRSSTEAELVAANDVMGQLLWTQHFLREQGYSSTETVLYQDNQSAMLLEKNGRSSSSKRTRHLEIRYFFITDHVANKDFKIEYCPTEEMVADFFTKPLQGSLFRRLRDAIMNVDPQYQETSDQRSVLGNEHLGVNYVSGAEPGVQGHLVPDNLGDNTWKLVKRRQQKMHLKSKNTTDTAEKARKVDNVEWDCSHSTVKT